MKLWALILPLCLAGCGQKPVDIPRPRAYPRITLYPATYHKAEIQRHILTVNDSVCVKTLGDGWFDIIYPSYGVTVNCTMSDYSPEIIGNRMERIDRNLGSAVAEVARMPAGIVVVAPAALRTPVQLLATDSLTWTLSGAAVTDFPAGISSDSIAPIINAVAADMITLVKNL